jgi:hypothetical protein
MEAVKPGTVVVLVPPTSSPDLSERAWRGVQTLSGFSARNFTPITGLPRINRLWLIDIDISVCHPGSAGGNYECCVSEFRNPGRPING